MTSALAMLMAIHAAGGGATGLRADFHTMLTERGLTPDLSAEERSLYDLYVGILEVGNRKLAARDAPEFRFRQLRQSFVKDAEFFVASGSTDGGHRFFTDEVLVRHDGRVLFIKSDAENLDDGGYRRRWKRVTACRLEIRQAWSKMENFQEPAFSRLQAREKEACVDLTQSIENAFAATSKDDAAVRGLMTFLANVHLAVVEATVAEKLPPLRDPDAQGHRLHGKLYWREGAKRPFVPFSAKRSGTDVQARGFITAEGRFGPSAYDAALKWEGGHSEIVLDHLGDTVFYIE
jgi:hypothetical protein